MTETTTARRAEQVYTRWAQANEKFDYFITGTSGALVAYITQNFTAEKISISPNTAELLALLMLIASVFAGFKRIEKVVLCQRVNHTSLQLAEERKQFTSSIPGKPLMDYTSRRVVGPDEVEIRIQTLTSAIETADTKIKNEGEKSLFWYKTRNILLGSGFLLLVAAKVWAAYV